MPYQTIPCLDDRNDDEYALAAAASPRPLLVPPAQKYSGYGNKAADIISSFNGCQSCQRSQLAGVAVLCCFFLMFGRKYYNMTTFFSAWRC